MGRGFFVETISGHIVYPLFATPGDISVEDIAHHLSHINRFNGATRYPYSVAQHSALMADYALRSGYDLRYVMAVLMHDAAEAYLQDLITPIKLGCINSIYETCTQTVDKAIRDFLVYCFGMVFPADADALIRSLDTRILLTERATLMPRHSSKNSCGSEIERGTYLPVKIKKWSARKAKKRFLKLFWQLTNNVKKKGSDQ